MGATAWGTQAVLLGVSRNPDRHGLAKAPNRGTRLSIDLGFEDSEPVPEGVIVLSDGTWYEPPMAD